MAIVLSMYAIVLAGFWPYYRALPGGTGASGVVHLHAAVFSGWMLLLLAQVILVLRGRVGTHRRLGRLGIGYAVLLLVLGAAVTVVTSVQGVVEGRDAFDDVAAFLLLPLGDLVLFGGFFSAGIALRRRRELHSRLMLLAAVALIFPGAARLAGNHGALAVLAVWLLPLGLAIGRDWHFLGRIERVYLFGLAVLLLAYTRVWLMDSGVWLPVGRALLRAFLPADHGG